MADTRTNAGVDTIATGRKLHSWAVRGKARALDPGRAAQTEMQIGQIVTDTIATQSQGADKAMQATFGATMLVGGQIHGSAPGLFLIYPKGNFTEASEDTPLLVIGVTKCKKPLLARAYDAEASFEQAIKLLLVSYAPTITATLSVGLPIDCLVYRTGVLAIGHHSRNDEHDPYYSLIASGRGEALRCAFNQLADFRGAGAPHCAAR